MNIILFGAPGSGKGTQAILLSDYLKIRHISLGDILREKVKNGDPLGQEVKKYMEKGVLVPDKLVARVIDENINSQGFILDGYPRNLSQAETLEDMVTKKNIDINAFIFLDVDEQTIVNRLSQRRVCKICGANYHLKNIPPKNEGVCDICGGKLVQRKDDQPEVIKKRWQVFSEESQKLLNFYRNKGKLIQIDGRGDKEATFEEIKTKLQC